jgi:hypothetical protein
MDVNKMLADLREEHNAIDQAIMALQRLAAGQGKPRGRPPAWMSALNSESSQNAPKRRGRPPGSKNKPKEEAAEEAA